MAKRAFCVGINDYPQAGMDLNGCVNDAHGWASLLADHYDFTDVTVALDKEATHARILGGLQSLLKGSRSGDVLVFTNSSHGTYLADTDKDERDYDEAMCPYDTEDHPLVDDELREMFGNLAEGVHLTVISDSCHSGTVTRAVLEETPDKRRVRFMNPELIGRRGVGDIRERCSKRPEKHPESQMKDVLLSGCKSNQYSYDAVIEGAPHGAFTFYALQVITAAKYKLTYEQLHKKTVAALAGSNYDQEPQLEGRAEGKRRQIFS